MEKLKVNAMLKTENLLAVKLDSYNKCLKVILIYYSLYVRLI